MKMINKKIITKQILINKSLSEVMENFKFDTTKIKLIFPDTTSLELVSGDGVSIGSEFLRTYSKGEVSKNERILIEFFRNDDTWKELQFREIKDTKIEVIHRIELTVFENDVNITKLVYTIEKNPIDIVSKIMAKIDFYQEDHLTKQLDSIKKNIEISK